jgi:hypothetical protein
MLTHHDNRSYETAKGEMAEHLRTRFERTIKEGRAQAQVVLEQIDREVPRDLIVPGPKAEFVPVSEGVELLVGGEEFSIHDHAFRQLCNRGKMHVAYASSLLDFSRKSNGDAQWARDLLAHNLNVIYHDGPGAEAKYLMRTIADEKKGCHETRGWLSDSYRRLDCRPLLHAFHEMAIQEAGAVPVRGYALPTKVAVRCVLPTIFEPIPNEPMLYGLEWYNSDYGHGAHSLRSFVHKPWCTNEATRDDCLRQWHSGARLHEDFAYSQKTYELDQKASVAALGDVVKQLLDPAKVDETFRIIDHAHAEKIDSKKVPSMTKALTKTESLKVIELFDGRDNDNLPEGKTRWRLSNAISFLATNTDNQYRAMQLERVAGRVSGLATSRGSDED